MTLRNVFLGFILSISAMAANGPYFESLSPISRSMGGTTVGNVGAPSDAMFRNPALLPWLAGKEASVAGELNMHVAKMSTTANNSGLGEKSSSAGAKFFPDLAAQYKWNEKVGLGLGFVTYGGSAINYVGEATLSQIATDNRHTRLMLSGGVQVTDGLSFGVTPFMNYGMLSLNTANAAGVQSTREPHGATSLGATIGAAYQIDKTWFFGLSYSTKNTLEYKELLDLDAFGPGTGSANSTGVLDTYVANQPYEAGFGVSYLPTPELKLAFDYRIIGWADSPSFNRLQWKNQHVFALGAQYQMQAWQFRLGYNHASSPIKDVSGESGLTVINDNGHAIFSQYISMLDIVALPAISSDLFTVGLGYDVDSDLGINGAFSLSPRTSITRSGTGLDPTGTPGAYSYTNTLLTWTVSAGAVYHF